MNPYGTLPSESWATYRSTMLAECLADHGYEVTQFISNFEHRSKTFRTRAHEVSRVREGYTIHIVPGTGYSSHVSLARVRHERAYARALVHLSRGLPRPDFLVLAEPALCYYDILVEPLLATGRTQVVLDVIDLWPELFELVLPGPLKMFSGALLAPLYAWRRRLYRYPRAVVAVAEDYLDLARRLTTRADALFEVVYWGYDTREVAAAPDARVQELVARKQPRDVWVVYAGTLGENYDIESILQVAAQLPAGLAATHRVTFVIAGDGPLKQRVDASVGEHLVFLGRLGAAQLPLLYRHADIALSTYKGESTVAIPIKAFDYLRHGLPMVNSLGRDLGRLVQTHEVGVNYEAGSVASLYRALERLIRDEPARRRYAANARALAESFSAERQYTKFVDVLRRLDSAAERGR